MLALGGETPGQPQRYSPVMRRRRQLTPVPARVAGLATVVLVTALTPAVSRAATIVGSPLTPSELIRLSSAF